MTPDSEGLGTVVEDGTGLNLTQPSGILYFSLYTFFRSTCISNISGPEFFVEVCLNNLIYIYIYIRIYIYIY